MTDERGSADTDNRDANSLKTDLNESNRLQAQLYTPNIELERYKAKLDFWKFTIVSGFAAIVIAAIPPSFQLATAHLESVKSDAERAASEQRFQDQYVQQFLDKALTQDVELRIRFADYFANVSAKDVRGGWVKYRDALIETRKRIRDSIEDKRKKIADIVAKTKGSPNFESNLLEEKLAWDYGEVGYVKPDSSVIRDPNTSSVAASAASAAASSRVGDLVRDTCEKEFDRYKDDNPGFVVAVSKDLGIKLSGTADEIIDSIRKETGWRILPDGVAAAQYARNGYLVVGGLKGSEQTLSNPLGHVVIVVDGPIAHDAYPTAYWTRLGGGGQRAKTIN
jgi:hypothetical protein